MTLRVISCEIHHRTRAVAALNLGVIIRGSRHQIALDVNGSQHFAIHLYYISPYRLEVEVGSSRLS